MNLSKTLAKFSSFVIVLNRDRVEMKKKASVDVTRVVRRGSRVFGAKNGSTSRLIRIMDNIARNGDNADNVFIW